MKSSILIHPEELNIKWIDRLVDNGIGVLGLHPVGGKNQIESLKNLTILLKDKSFLKLIDYAKSKNLDVEYEIHSAGFLLDREYFNTNPEYFQLNEKGERVKDINFCVSSNALEIATQNALNLAKNLYGNSDYYCLWLDDGEAINCKCDRCKELSSSDQQLIFLNSLIKKLKKFNPNAKLAYLAYGNTLDLPTKVKPEEGIFLEYAPFHKWTTSVLGNDTQLPLAQKEVDMVKPLLEFFGKKNSRVLEYWLDNSLFSRWKKPPKQLFLDGDKIKREVSYYKELGFEQISVFGCFLGEDYEDLYGEPDIKPLADALR